jgi:hypothetical protein
MALTAPFPGKGASPYRYKWLVVTVAFAIVALLASPNSPLGGFWRPSADFPAPTGIQLALFMIVNLFEAAAFGLGAAFLLYGLSLVRSILPTSRGLAIAAYVSIGWLLVSWWPHDSLHIANGMDMNGLLAIEYGFHVTLMIAGAILVRFIVAVARERGGRLSAG